MDFYCIHAQLSVRNASAVVLHGVDADDTTCSVVLDGVAQYDYLCVDDDDNTNNNNNVNASKCTANVVEMRVLDGGARVRRRVRRAERARSPCADSSALESFLARIDAALPGWLHIDLDGVVNDEGGAPSPWAERTLRARGVRASARSAPPTLRVVALYDDGTAWRAVEADDDDDGAIAGTPATLYATAATWRFDAASADTLAVFASGSSAVATRAECARAAALAVRAARAHLVVCYDAHAERRYAATLRRDARTRATPLLWAHARTLFERYVHDAAVPWHALVEIARARRPDLYFIDELARHGVFSTSRELAATTGALWQHALAGHALAPAEMLVLRACRRRHILPPPPRAPCQRPLRGALVLDAALGAHDVPVGVVDFASLYPSVAIEYNVCWLSRNSNDDNDNNNDRDDDTRDDDDGELLLPALWRELLQRRRTERHAARARALKFVANSLYGCLASPRFRFYAPHLAAEITRHGRATLRALASAAERYATSLSAHGASAPRIVAGDTDSLFVACATFEQVDDVVDALQAHCAERYGAIQCKLDAIYKPLIVCGRKAYVGIDVESSRLVDKSGITKRSSSRVECGLAGALLECALRADAAEVRRRAATLRADVECAPEADFVMYRRLGRAPADYAEPAPAHVQVARADRTRHYERGDHVATTHRVADGTLDRARYASDITARLAPLLAHRGLADALGADVRGAQRATKRRTAGAGKGENLDNGLNSDDADNDNDEDDALNTAPRTARKLGAYSCALRATPTCAQCTLPLAWLALDDAASERVACACGTASERAHVECLIDALAECAARARRGATACACDANGNSNGNDDDNDNDGVVERCVAPAQCGTPCECGRTRLVDDRSLDVLRQIAAFDRATAPRHSVPLRTAAHNYTARTHPIALY